MKLWEIYSRYYSPFRKSGRGGSEQPEPDAEGQEKRELIPYGEIFAKIDECKKRVKEIEAEAGDEIKDPGKSAYWSGKIFEIKHKTADFIGEQLAESFEAVSNNPYHELAHQIFLLKFAVNKFNFKEIRSILEELQKISGQLQK